MKLLGGEPVFCTLSVGTTILRVTDDVCTEARRAFRTVDEAKL